MISAMLESSRTTGFFNEQPIYVDRVSGQWSSSLWALTRGGPQGTRRIDPLYRTRVENGVPPGLRTWVAGVRELGRRQQVGLRGEIQRLALHDRNRTIPNLDANRLRDALAAQVDGHRSVAVALSGGVDSAAVYILLHELLGAPPTAYTLASDIPGYCEREETERIARSLGVHDLRIVYADQPRLTAQLSACLYSAARPIWNLHPVSRHILAHAVAADGFTALATGDGADQLFARRFGDDYLPVFAPITRGAGLRLSAPFIAATVVRARGGTALTKPLLHRIVAKAFPGALPFARKQPRLVPMTMTPTQCRLFTLSRLEHMLHGTCPLGVAAESCAA